MMIYRRIPAFVLASVLMCGAMASCSKKVKTTSGASSQAETSAPDETVDKAVPDVGFDNAVVAGAGDAYLAIVDEQWWIQYWGSVGENNQLSYDAGVAHIDGNGDYTVSVTTDTEGFRYDATEDVNGECVPAGLGFAAVIIEEGEKEVPNAVITINSVKVDGRELELKKKNYTNTEDGDIRANIFNEWVRDNGLPGDARVAEGALFNGNDNKSPSDINDGSCSAQIIDRDEFKEWSKVEVSFTVSGLDG